ncbi:type IV toxin-antitoxin system AbiEi family antitoxin [Leifsonia poae]|uniref:type IV toxin-antitoxin system AbiEi family antitoxin n=1 Tax=Leifsonia poae TaxID=110933 RepID=UPI001CBF86CE|nr:type IV toxin-antitoxin system AbiEi family antitoxin [Leifsonia poae]
MASLLPRLLTTETLPAAELCALRLDGALYRVADAFATLDTPDDAELRAAAFLLSAPRSAVADRGTASWIHGTRPEPPLPLQVCVTAPRRGSTAVALRLDIRQTALSAGDTVRLSGARVTAPARTAIDLLRTEPHFTDSLSSEIRALLDRAGVGPESCRRKILRHARTPGTVRAIERLEALGQPALTRYTS